MKLLFQTTGTAGNTELKELMGFIDADLKFKNILPDIITSTNDVIDLVGIEVYDKAVALYNNGVILLRMIWRTLITVEKCDKTITKNYHLNGWWIEIIPLSKNATIVA
jgi:hypothetical protein